MTVRKRTSDPATWFDSDELERCPHCREQRLLPQDELIPLRLCLGCGPVMVASLRSPPSSSLEPLAG
jgi:hypothetical protein